MGQSRRCDWLHRSSEIQERCQRPNCAALWWLIENVSDEFEMPPEEAADKVEMLCGLAKEMMD